MDSTGSYSYEKIYASSSDGWKNKIELGKAHAAKAGDEVALTISKSGIIGHILGWNINVYVSSQDHPEEPPKIVRVTKSSVERALKGVEGDRTETRE